MSDQSAETELSTKKSADEAEREELIRRMYREARELEERLKKNERLTAEDLAVRVNLSV